MTTTKPKRSRARQAPPLPEMLAAITRAMRYSHGGVDALHRVLSRVAAEFSTTHKLARKWMTAALTDPEQNEFVWVDSTDNKYCKRVVRRADDPERFEYATELEPGVGHLPQLAFNYSGHPVPMLSGAAVRNMEWILTRAAFDGRVADLKALRDKKKAEEDTKSAKEAAETERLIGEPLGLIRAMLVGAGIIPEPDMRVLSSFARTVTTHGETYSFGRVGISLENRDILLLAEWLRAKGVEPVAEFPPGDATASVTL